MTELNFFGLLKPGFKISDTKEEPWAEDSPAQTFTKSKQGRCVVKCAKQRFGKVAKENHPKENTNP